jgi:RNA polymerase sigma-70 factor (sigma-E family)
VRRAQLSAFEGFVRENADSLMRLSYTLCGDRGRAEDATQEALTRVYLRWGRLRQPLPYARRCLVNATRDQWRQRSRREERERVVGMQPAEVPARLDDTIVDRDHLVRALRRLPYSQRAAVVLRHWHQLSEQETAEALGNSVGTVKKQTHRGLARLREELQSELQPIAGKV